MKQIIRINLTEGKITTEPVIDRYRNLGGRALTSQILIDEVDPGCEPLGKRNKLIFAPGLLGGSFLSSSSRLSVGGKSPLTGGIKEANAGGTSGGALSKLGIKALIIEGGMHADRYQHLYVSKNKIELRPAEMIGQGVYSNAKMFYECYGDKISQILIGQAGERCYFAAGITSTDTQGRPSRFMGRGGLGAVMGTKGLKAIVIDPSGAEAIGYHNRKAFQELNRKIVKLLKENPITGTSYPKYGTAAMASFTNSINALPTRNFSAGNFECTNSIDGEYLHHVITTRGGEGKTTHACMPGCVIKCSNIFANTEGKEVVAPLEYETIGMMGSNIGIGNLDHIARLNYICNDLGLDTIEMGAAIGVAMDQGLIPFGDVEKATALLEEVGKNTVLGRVLGQGALITGCVLGSKRIPVVKGQAMPAYDPRAVKGLGVTYATSPMGADHTAGYTIRAEVDHTDPRQQLELSRKAQLTAMIADTMGICLFVMTVLGAHLDKIAKLYEFFSGQPTCGQSLYKAAAEAIAVEREFNRRAGLGPTQDRLPEFMIDELLPVTNSVFDVPNEDLLKIDRY